jgi:hypothetical protein
MVETAMTNAAATRNFFTWAGYEGAISRAASIDPSSRKTITYPMRLICRIASLTANTSILATTLGAGPLRSLKGQCAARGCHHPALSPCDGPPTATWRWKPR